MIYFLPMTPLTCSAFNFLILLGRFHSVLTEIINPIVPASFDSQRWRVIMLKILSSFLKQLSHLKATVYKIDSPIIYVIPCSVPGLGTFFVIDPKLQLRF